MDVDKLVESLNKTKDDSSKNTTGLVTSILAVLALIIGITVMAFRAWKSGKKMAQLLHEKALQEELKEQALVNAKLATLEEDKQQHIRASVDALSKAGILEAEAFSAKIEHEQALETIKNLTSWEQVDAYRSKK